jgi:hypothetical protein
VTARQSANGRRDTDRRKPADWIAAYQPAEGTPLLACRAPHCGAYYLDDEPARAAHKAVFGHKPRPREPERAERTEGEP